MNLTADLAVVALAALALVDTVLDRRFRMRVADRLRVVNPAKTQPGQRGSVQTAPAEPETAAPGLPKVVGM